MRYIHQYGAKGNHRLGRTKSEANSLTKESKVKWGEWAPWRAPAMLGQYLAVTDYYAESQEFPDSKWLYRVQKDVWPMDTETV